MAEFEHIKGELEHARLSEVEAVEGKRLAETRISVLEKKICVAAKEQERIRERTELRLNALQRRFEQDAREGGVQARCPATLFAPYPCLDQTLC